MKLRFAFLLAIVSFFAQAQILEPVKWSHTVEEAGDDTYKIKFKATIDEGWHLYSQYLPDTFPRPEPTTFFWDTLVGVDTVGLTLQSEAETEYDPNFEMELSYFSHSAEFEQLVKLEADYGLIIGAVSFMTCDDSRCLPPEYYDFRIELGDVPEAPTKENPEEGKTDPAPEKPGSEETSVRASSLWTIFATGFGGGLLALLMPCIFPMIPLTVSFFTKQAKSRSEGIRKAIIYGLSIITIYVLLGMLVTVFTGDSSALNAMSTDPWFNLVFFALFVVFAISFFGAFEITLPSKWVNKADEASNKGGLVGIFFMAFTLALVSFSCTGPIIGSLLVDAAVKGSYLGPAIGMLGFSFALALPFTLFAIFPGWMNSMPKSGGWLNTVKVSLGFLELAFALKFLSTADMVWQAHWLHREVFLACWVAIAFALALYLFGAFKMPLDSPVDSISVPRMLFGLFFLIFGIYLVPGIFGAPVKIIAGFPPPEHYAEVPGGLLSSHGSSQTNQDYDFGDHCPNGIPCFNDLDAGIEYAKDEGKPILLDFTGWGCVNCRKMEEKVWTDQSVHKRLANEYVLISLYVDEREKLPKSEQYVSESGKKIREIGQKWSDFQATNYGANSQPYYLVLGHENLEPLIEPAAYDPSVSKFVDWLDRGKAAFEAQK